MPRTLRLALLTSTVAAVVAPLTAAAPATAATLSTYSHGSYAQSHFNTEAGCKTARSSAMRAVSQYGGSSVRAGHCHRIDAGAGATRQTGYVYDLTYKRSNALWYGDKNLGANPSSLTGAHSFLNESAYATRAEAVRVEGAVTASIKSASFGGKVTWRSDVKQNAVTKKWEYHLTYDNRIPLYSSDTEISQSPGVTLPSLSVVSPTPTNPTPDATNPGTVTPKPPTTGDITPTVPEKVGVSGLDVSSHTVLNDWAGWKAAGVKFIYTKATEGTYYKNPKWAAQYTGAYNNGILRGSYHFAIPGQSTGAEQADYFVARGGGWSADGKTLPGVVDLEWEPYGGPACYGLSQVQMRKWVNDFQVEYKAKTGVYPTIYTARSWWDQCVGPDTSLAKSPLWVARYAPSVGTLPQTWSLVGKKHMIWQNAAIDAKGYDTNIFNGTMTQLAAFAKTGSF